MNLARVAPGNVVLVVGIGAVGLGIVQLASRAGADVIAVSRTPAKLEKALALGAGHAIVATTVSVAERVRDITAGHDADVVMELVATNATMLESTNALAKRGRLVFIGYSEDGYTVHPIHLVISEASVMGSVGNTLAELKQAVELVARGIVATVVDRTLPLEEFQTGIDALTRGEPVGRVVGGTLRAGRGGGHDVALQEVSQHKRLHQCGVVRNDVQLRSGYIRAMCNLP